MLPEKFLTYSIICFIYFIPNWNRHTYNPIKTFFCWACFFGRFISLTLLHKTALCKFLSRTCTWKRFFFQWSFSHRGSFDWPCKYIQPSMRYQKYSTGMRYQSKEIYSSSFIQILRFYMKKRAQYFYNKKLCVLFMYYCLNYRLPQTVIIRHRLHGFWQIYVRTNCLLTWFRVNSVAVAFTCLQSRQPGKNITRF